MNSNSDDTSGEIVPAEPESAVPDIQETAEKVVNTAQKAQAASPVVQGVVGGLGSFFGNPITWIVCAVFLVIVLVLSSVQIVGQNENANGCSGIGGQNANLPNSASLGGTGDGSGAKGMTLDQQKKIANAIMSFLMTTQFKALGNKPMSKNQAAAFAGNWFQESSFDTSNSLNQQFNLNTPNSQIMAIGNPGPLQPVLGLGMWGYERRYKLAALAESKGMKWNDIGAQLLYFQTEFDGDYPYDGKHMIAEGFNDPTKSVGDLAYIINKVFEISGEARNSPGNQNREKWGQIFADEYNGASADSGITGGSCLIGAGNFDASSAVKLAIGIAWPMVNGNVNPKAYVPPSDVIGVNEATPAYKAAKAAAMKIQADPESNLYASCDRFVATVTKLTMDKNFPWGATGQQIAYMKSHPNLWQPYHSKSERKPGDIWITNVDGHVMMYVGEIPGVGDATASASFHQRVGSIGLTAWMSDNLVETSSEHRQYTGFHYIGPTNSGSSINGLVNGETTGASASLTGWNCAIAGCSGRFSSGYGSRPSPGGIGSTFHEGNDFATPVGTPLHAMNAGVVKSATTYPSDNNNKILVIDYGGGVESQFIHMSKFNVPAGTQVKAGQVVGLSGNTGKSTGPHLHLNIVINGSKIDPAPWLQARNAWG